MLHYSYGTFYKETPTKFVSWLIMNWKTILSIASTNSYSRLTVFILHCYYKNFVHCLMWKGIQIWFNWLVSFQCCSIVIYCNSKEHHDAVMTSSVFQCCVCFDDKPMTYNKEEPMYIANECLYNVLLIVLLVGHTLGSAVFVVTLLWFWTTCAEALLSN